LGEVLPDRAPDRDQVRASAGDRDDRDPEPPREDPQVHDVEPSDRHPVQEEGADPRSVRRPRQHRADPLGPVGAVDLDPVDHHALDRPGDGEDHGDERGVPMSARERAVVHPDDPKVRLGERARQG
jgi:hypothetical protein